MDRALRTRYVRFSLGRRPLELGARPGWNIRHTRRLHKILQLTRYLLRSVLYVTSQESEAMGINTFFLCSTQCFRSVVRGLAGLDIFL